MMKISPYYVNSINQMIRLILIPVILLLIIMVSCQKDPGYNFPSNKKLVILAEISAGDSAYIPISLSESINNGNPISFGKVSNAIVTITDEDGNEINLQHNNSPSYDEVPGSVYSAAFRFKAKTTYNITATHPEWGTAQASTKIPDMFSVVEMKVDEGEFLGREIIRFSFRIEDPIDEKNLYIVEGFRKRTNVYRFFYWQGVQYDFDTLEGEELYERIKDEEGIELPIIRDTISAENIERIPVLVEDINTDNNTIGDTDSSFNRIFLRDSLFNGQAYTTNLSLYKSSITPADKREIGMVILHVKSVSREFYDYLLQYEKYKYGFVTMPVNQLSSPAGNINNGLGVFGGSYKKEWKFLYEDLN